MGNELSSQQELAQAVSSELNLYFHHSYGTYGTGPCCCLVDAAALSKSTPRSAQVPIRKFEESFLALSSGPPSLKFHIEAKEVHVEVIAKDSLLPPIWRSEPHGEDVKPVTKDISLAQYIASIGAPTKNKTEAWTEENISSLKAMIEEVQRRLQILLSSGTPSLHPNVLALLDVIEARSGVYLVHEAVPMSLEDVIRCSPHVLARSPQLQPQYQQRVVAAAFSSAASGGVALLQPHFSQLVSPVTPTLTIGALFLVYQLLQVLKHCHDRGLTHGALSTSAIRVLTSPAPSCSKAPAAMWLLLSSISAPIPPLIPDLPWRDALHRWQSKSMSNFEYLMWVNEAAGRRFGDPDLHPILPWVTDFSAPTGLRRDLSRTKFRLSKGDEQLDQTYIASKSGRRHHVSDMLNVLSYYTYKARRVPVEVLQKHVRSNFQPSEYPANMSRLYATTPHEAIPEFYTDAELFRSIHADMPDLGVPEWASSPEDFIAQHRALLESDAVSAQLHLWLDITFGHLVRGPEAVVAKNLPLVDPQVPFNSGFVQLFSQPHPKRFTRNSIEVSLTAEASSGLVLAPIHVAPQQQQQAKEAKPIFSLFSGSSIGRTDEKGDALGLGKLLSGLKRNATGASSSALLRKVPTDDNLPASTSSTTSAVAPSPSAEPSDAANRFVASLMALERSSASLAQQQQQYSRPPLSPGRSNSVIAVPGTPSPSASSASLAKRSEVSAVNVSSAHSYNTSVQEDLDAAASIILQLCTRVGCGALVDTPVPTDRLPDGPMQSLLETLNEFGIERALLHTVFPSSFAPVYKFLAGFMQQTTPSARLQHALAGLPQLQDEEHLTALVFPFLLPLFRALPVQALPLFSYLARLRWPSATPYWKNLQVPLEEMYQKRELTDLQANILSPSFVDIVWRLFPLQTVVRRFVPFLFDVLRTGGQHAAVAAGTIRLLVKHWGPVLAMNHLITPLFGFIGRQAEKPATVSGAAAASSASSPSAKAVDILAELARDLGDGFVATHFLPLLTDVLLQFSTRTTRAESGLTAALELLMRLLEVLSVGSLLRLLQPPVAGATHSSVLLLMLLNPPPYAQAMLSLAVILVTLAHRLGTGATLTYIAPHVAQFLSTYAQLYDQSGRWKGTRGADDACLQQVYSRQVVYALYVPMAAFVPTLSAMLPSGLTDLLDLLAEQYQSAERRPSVSSTAPVLVPPPTATPSVPVTTLPALSGTVTGSGSALPLSSLLASQTAAVQSPLLSTSPLGLSSPAATPPSSAHLRRRTISTSGDVQTLTISNPELPLEDADDSDELISEPATPLVPSSPASASATTLGQQPTTPDAHPHARPWYDTAQWAPASDFQDELATANTPEEAAAMQHIGKVFPFRRQVHSWRAHVGTVRTLLPQGDSERLLVTSAFRDSVVRVWRIAEARIQRTHLNHRAAVLAVDWVDRDGGLVASCDSGEAQVWSVETGQELYRSEPGGADLTSLVAQSSGPRPCSHVLVTGTTDNTLQFVDLRAGEIVGEWKSITGSASIRSIAVSPDENWLATGSSSGVACMLDLRTGCVLHSWKAFESSIVRVAARGNHHLVVSSPDKTVGMKIFNLRLADPTNGSQPLAEKTVRGAVDSWAVLRRDELVTSAGHKLGYCHLTNTDGPLVSQFPRRLQLPGTKQSFPNISAVCYLPWHQLCVVGTETGHVKYVA